MENTFDIATANGTILRAQAVKLGISVENAPKGDTEALRKWLIEEIAKKDSPSAAPSTPNQEVVAESTGTPLAQADQATTPIPEASTGNVNQNPPSPAVIPESNTQPQSQSRKLRLKEKSGSYTDFFNGVLQKIVSGQEVEYDEKLINTGLFEEVIGE